MRGQQDGNLVAVHLLEFHFHVLDIPLSFDPLLEDFPILRVHVEISDDIYFKKLRLGRISQHIEKGLVTI
jgi:hypothetical protein